MDMKKQGLIDWYANAILFYLLQYKLWLIQWYFCFYSKIILGRIIWIVFENSIQGYNM